MSRNHHFILQVSDRCINMARVPPNRPRGQAPTNRAPSTSTAQTGSGVTQVVHPQSTLQSSNQRASSAVESNPAPNQLQHPSLTATVPRPPAWEAVSLKDGGAWLVRDRIPELAALLDGSLLR